MISNKTFDDLARRITEMLPGDITQMRSDVESNVRVLLQNTLSKMNLVTREEFDVQSALLERTREKLAQLEQKLADLEDND